MDKTLTLEGVLLKLLSDFGPIVLGVLIFWFAQWLLRDNISGAYHGMIKELRSLSKLEWRMESLNAALMILGFILVLVLPREFTMPNLSNSPADRFEYGAKLAYFIAFGLLGLFCLSIVKNQK